MQPDALDFRPAYGPDGQQCGAVEVTPAAVARWRSIERAALAFQRATVLGDRLDVYAAGRAILEALAGEPAPSALERAALRFAAAERAISAMLDSRTEPPDALFDERDAAQRALMGATNHVG